MSAHTIHVKTCINLHVNVLNSLEHLDALNTDICFHHGNTKTHVSNGQHLLSMVLLGICILKQSIFVTKPSLCKESVGDKCVCQSCPSHVTVFCTCQGTSLTLWMWGQCEDSFDTMCLMDFPRTLTAPGQCYLSFSHQYMQIKGTEGVTAFWIILRFGQKHEDLQRTHELRCQWDVISTSSSKWWILFQNKQKIKLNYMSVVKRPALWELSQRSTKGSFF